MSSDRSVIEALHAAVSAREPVVLATVVRTDRSVPRHAGSKMLIDADGSSVGSVGGGEMEARVVAAAESALESGVPQLLEFELVDPSDGDPGVCGGRSDIYVEPYMPSTTIYIVGLGHVGRAVAQLADWMGYRVVGWDDRSELVDTDENQAFLTGSITDALEGEPLDAHSYVVMVTRNVALDVEILPALLDSPAPFIGIMGSSRRWETTRAKLSEVGFADEQLDRVTSPIGLDLRAETPEEIAVSILAQIVEQEHSKGAPSSS